MTRVLLCSTVLHLDQPIASIPITIYPFLISLVARSNSSFNLPPFGFTLHCPSLSSPLHRSPAHCCRGRLSHLFSPHSSLCSRLHSLHLPHSLAFSTLRSSSRSFNYSSPQSLSQVCVPLCTLSLRPALSSSLTPLSSFWSIVQTIGSRTFPRIERIRHMQNTHSFAPGAILIERIDAGGDLRQEEGTAGTE